MAIKVSHMDANAKIELAASDRPMSHAVSIVTVDRLPRHPSVTAQLVRALADRGIPIDSLASGLRRDREQLVITVPVGQAPLVVEIAGTIAARFGIGPVTVDPSWTELTVDIPAGRSSSVVVAELYERLAERRIETRAVMATANQVSCVVRPEAGDQLRQAFGSILG
jgi:aspartokinase